MQYRTMKDGTKVSALGYGCMRFSKKTGSIDIEKAKAEILRAIEAGVNYFDTAYIYPGSEEALGQILDELGKRDEVYIATKLPHYLIKSVEKAESMFQEEIRRLRTDHVDYYLMHMLTDLQTWNGLLAMGMGEWIEEKMKSGAIRHIGFSYHGNTASFKELIDAYDWDFAQVQYNYMDEYSQAGVEGVKYAASKNIPIIIMEGLRGGRLVNLLPSAAKEKIASFPGGMTPAKLAFRWLYNQPEVTVVLSGMNSLEMVEENIITAEESVPGSMTDAELKLVEDVKEEINKTIKVGCTGCGYCMPCPKGVDIPVAFRCWNEMYAESKSGARREYLQCTTFRKTSSSASQCVQCGKCEQHCPQHLEIRSLLKQASKELETPVYKGVRWGIRTFHLWG